MSSFHFRFLPVLLVAPLLLILADLASPSLVYSSHLLSKRIKRMQWLFSKFETATSPTAGLTALPHGYWLAFRGTAGVGQSVYDAYTNVGHNDDDDRLRRLVFPCGCLSVDGRQSCDRHYRSAVLDDWPSTAIDRVRLSWYEEGVEKAYIVFDGKDSTYLNWLSQDRVIESSWNDVATETYNYFSVAGHAHMKRRFFINRNYGGCPSDKGWSVALDQVDACSWGQGYAIPAFLYSRLNTCTSWKISDDVGSADVLAVSVKFLACCLESGRCDPDM